MIRTALVSFFQKIKRRIIHLRNSMPDWLIKLIVILVGGITAIVALAVWELIKKFYFKNKTQSDQQPSQIPEDTTGS